MSNISDQSSAAKATLLPAPGAPAPPEPSAHAGLRAWRHAAGLSQDDVVKRLTALGSAVARPTYSFWEKDRRPDYENAVAIESVTNGAVPIEAWGYSALAALDVAAMRRGRARAGRKAAKAGDQ